MNGARRRVRQADLAQMVGVSQATVSLVLAGRSGGNVRIPDETRARILKLAGELGYVANPVARSLAGGTNRLLGLFTFESVFPIDQHDFYYPFLKGIEAAAEAHQYDLILFTSATGSDGSRSVYRGEVNRLALADGCVMIGRTTKIDEITRLRDEGFPIVLVGRRDIPGDEVDYVTADYAHATEQVVDHLVGLGHRRIAYLPAADRSEPTDDRDAGFRAAQERHSLDLGDLTLPVAGHGPEPAEVERLLDDGATAFVVHEGAPALKLLDELARRGLSVPGDASVAILGDLSIPTPVRITGFEIPRQSMGEEAVGLLLRRIESSTEPAATSIELPCRFVAGETTGPCVPGRSRG